MSAARCNGISDDKYMTADGPMKPCLRTTAQYIRSGSSRPVGCANHGNDLSRSTMSSPRSCCQPLSSRILKVDRNWPPAFLFELVTQQASRRAWGVNQRGCEHGLPDDLLKERADLEICLLERLE